ncbi:MAG: hypothetical protein WB505_20630 [Pseudolabrys sp.]
MQTSIVPEAGHVTYNIPAASTTPALPAQTAFASLIQNTAA